MKRKPRRNLLRILLTASLMAGMTACSSNTDDTGEADRVYLSHLDQARFYQEQGQYKAALQEAQSAIQSKPGQREPYLIVSRIFLDSGDAARAAQYYRELIEVNPEGASDSELNQARLGLAEALGMLGKFDEAEEALKGLTHPAKAEEVRMLTLQAQWALRQNQLDKAEHLANEVLKRDPQNAPALIVLSRIEWGRKAPDKAHALLDKARSAAPMHIEVLTWNAQLADLEKRWADAEEAYVALLDQVGSVDVMTPRKFTAISRLIEVLRAQGKHSEAFAYQEQLDKSSPGTVRNLYATALTAYEKGDLKAAEDNLGKLLDMAPGYKQAGILMGMVKVRQGDWKAADEYLSRYADPSSDPVAVTKALATTKLKLNQYEQAELLLRQVDDKDTDILTLMGIASAHSGNTSEAILNLEAALRQKPNDDLRKKLAQVYIQDRQATKALALIDQIKDNGDWDITGLRVSALASLAKFDEAEKQVRSWLKTHPDSAQGYNALGALYSQQKKWREADGAYAKAIAQDPDNLSAWHNRLKNLELQDDWKTVLKLAEEGLRKHPDDISLLRSYVRAAAKTDQGAEKQTPD
ncbi:tetratricopeptide repeat protein [Hahella sp. SMD15-11]|uniref:Tetratricopeptide repeat protein n=1 Tax=Thermohahella caldifontis TaxID=3142973 RepID=A0AB39UYN7_9GAMM